jgi:hypothetical protein
MIRTNFLGGHINGAKYRTLPTEHRRTGQALSEVEGSTRISTFFRFHFAARGGKMSM